jgi:predicted glycosyltransferase involved in capsule biosynthesis
VFFHEGLLALRGSIISVLDTGHFKVYIDLHFCWHLRRNLEDYPSLSGKHRTRLYGQFQTIRSSDLYAIHLMLLGQPTIAYNLSSDSLVASPSFFVVGSMLYVDA